MRYRTILCLAGAACTLFAPPLRAEAPKTPTEIAWLTSLDDAREQARKQKKILLVDFYADWCGPCRIMDQHTFRDRRVVSLANEAFVCVKIDSDRNRTLSRQYRISGLPTILFFGPEGELYRRIGGALMAAPFLGTMKGVVQAHHDFARLTQELEKDPDDLDAVLRLATRQVEFHLFSQALITLKRLDGKNGQETPSQDQAERVAKLRTLYVRISQGLFAAEQYNDAVEVARTALERVEAIDQISNLRATVINGLLAQNKLDEGLQEIQYLLDWKDAPDVVRRRAEYLRDRIHEQAAAKPRAPVGVRRR